MAISTELSIEKAWQLRNSQNLEAAAQMIRQLTSQLSPLKSKSKNRPSLSDKIEIQLLEASMLRAYRNLQASDELLAKIKNDVEQNYLPIPFQFYLQKGLNLFLQGYFPSALEFFNSATAIAKNPESKALALGNQILCLDNLNLPAKAVIEALVALEPELSADYWADVITPQLETLKRRTAFRNGDINSLFVSSSAPSLTQAQYFQCWASQLPYVNLAGQKENYDAALLVNGGHLLWKQYRLHTLLMDVRFADEKQVKISERVDRLYLWTWRWLTQPETVPLQVLEDCWAALEPCEVCSQSTIEDFIMLRLCMRWMSLFDKRWTRTVNEWLAKSTPPQLSVPPIFAIEEQVLDYLEATRKKERRLIARTLKRVTDNPLCQSQELHWKSFLNGCQFRESFDMENSEARDQAMAKLGKRLSSLSRKKVPASKNSVVIEPTSYRWQKDGVAGVSKPVCEVVIGLKETGSLSFSDILTRAFGLKGYNEDIHRNKVMNLLTRVRKLLPPEIEIFTKDQVVYSQGSFQNVRIQSSVQEFKIEVPSMLDRPCADLNRQHLDRWIQPRLVFKKLGGRNLVTRAELQSMLGLSKATANRLVRRWVDEGFLSLQKSGRAISYRIDNSQLSRLKISDS